MSGELGRYLRSFEGEYDAAVGRFKWTLEQVDRFVALASVDDRAARIAMLIDDERPDAATLQCILQRFAQAEAERARREQKSAP